MSMQIKVYFVFKSFIKFKLNDKFLSQSKIYLKNKTFTNLYKTIFI